MGSGPEMPDKQPPAQETTEDRANAPERTEDPTDVLIGWDPDISLADLTLMPILGAFVWLAAPPSRPRTATSPASASRPRWSAR